MHELEKLLRIYIESNYMGFQNGQYKSFGRIPDPIKYMPPYLATTNFTMEEIE